MAEPIIRKYKPGDEGKIVDLLKILFPAWKDRKNSLEFWQWKYISLPLGSDVVIAEKDSIIVGVGHRLNFYFKIGDHTQLSQYGDDFGVDPKNRQGGIYKNIMELIEKERMTKKITTMYTQTSNPIVAKDNLKRGRLPFPQKITRLIKVKDLDTQLKYKPLKNNFLVKLGFPLLKILNKLSSYTIPINKTKTEIKITETTNFDENVDELWNTIKKNYLFSIEKNKEYLNWRYADKRGGDYHILKAQQDDQTVGYLIYETIKENDYLEIYILDILTAPDKSEITYALIKEVCTYFEKININVMYYQTIEGHPYQKIFTKLGFIDSGSSPYIFLVINLEDYEIIKNAEPGQVSFTYSNTLH